MDHPFGFESHNVKITLLDGSQEIITLRALTIPEGDEVFNMMANIVLSFQRRMGRKMEKPDAETLNLLDNFSELATFINLPMFWQSITHRHDTSWVDLIEGNYIKDILEIFLQMNEKLLSQKKNIARMLWTGLNPFIPTEKLP